VTDLLLALDLGGTNLRATIFDPEGRRCSVAVADVPHEVDLPPVGRRWSPERLWEGACQAIRRAVEAVRADGEVVAVAATGQRLACAFLDGAGDTLYIGPNTDARGVAWGWRVEEAAEGALYDRTGRGMPFLFAPARILWFAEEEPDLVRRLRWVVGLGEWLAFRLAGELGLEPTSAVELLAVDVYTGQVWGELWERLGLDCAWLPPLRPAGAVLGGVTDAVAEVTGLQPGTAVVASPPDSMAGLVGSGAMEPGHSVVLAGSTMPVLGAAERPIADPTRRTWTGMHPVQGWGVNESNAGTTGFAWAWLVERVVAPLGGISPEVAYRRAEELAANAPPGSRQWLAFPGGSGVMNVSRPASFFSQAGIDVPPAPYLAPDAGAADLLRAHLEGIACIARANLEQVEEARGGRSLSVVLAEGMARSPVFATVLAGILQRPLRIPEVVEATSLGAAVAAAVGAGLHPDIVSAARAMVRAPERIAPEAAFAGVYDETYRRWRALHAKLQAL
jgi:autoinducer 2 (AI-2) kinase